MKTSDLTVLLFSAVLFSSCEKAGKKEALKDLNEASDAVVEDALKELDENGGLTVDKPIDQSRLLDALDKAGDTASGQEKIAIEMAKLSVSRIAELGGRLTEVSGDLMAGLDYSKVETREDIDALSERIRKYRKVNAEVKDSFNTGLIDDLKKEGDKRGLKGRSKADFFNAMESKFDRQLPVIHEIRDIDDELCATVLEQHGLLKENIGGWHWISEEAGIQIDEDEVLAAYNALAEKIQSLAVDQAEAQRKLLSIR